MISRSFLYKHFLFVAFLSLFPLLSFAEENKDIASLNISEAYILEQKVDSYSISFVLENLGAEAQFDIRYGLELLRNESGKQSIVDTVVFRGDSAVLTPGQKVTKVVDYSLESVPGGEYEVMVIARTAGGVRLGVANAGTIIVPDNEGLEIESPNCALTITGDEGIYSLNQGVDISSTEQLKLNCVVTNNNPATIKFIPQFETYRRTIYGEKIAVTNEDIEAITIKGGEKKEVEFVLPIATDPQAYDLIVSLRDAVSRKTLSNRLVTHYVLQGPSATIQDMALNKGVYAAGEDIILNLSWTKSADTFLGARGEGTSHEGELSALVSVTDEAGTACAENLSQILKDENTEIKVTAKQECRYPLASVQLVTATGASLDSHEVSVPKPEPIKTEPVPEPINHTLLYLTLGALLLATLVVFFLYLKQKSGKSEVNDSGSGKANAETKTKKKDLSKTLVLLLLLSATYFAGALRVEAVTFSASGVNFTVNTNKTSYVAGESISVTTAADASTCSNAANSYSVSGTVGTSTGTVSDDFSVLSTIYKSFSLTAPSTPGSYNITVTGVHNGATTTTSIPITVTSGSGVPQASITIGTCNLAEGTNKCNTTLTWSTLNANSPTPRICTPGSACTTSSGSNQDFWGTGVTGSINPIVIRSGQGTAYEVRRGSGGAVLNSATGTISSATCPTGFQYFDNVFTDPSYTTGCIPTCPLTSQPGRTIVDFYPSTWLLSGNDTRYYRPKVATLISPGTYDITAVGFDGGLGRSDPSFDYQTKERFWLRLYNGTTIISTTSATTDLAERVEYAWFNGVIENDYEITTTIDYVQPSHFAYKDSSSHSLIPVCAAFDTIPPPTASGTISGVGCNIEEGGDDCSGTLSWNIENAASPSVENLSTASVVSTNASGTSTAITIPYGMNTYAIRNGTSTITTASLLASCAASTTWNGTICAPTAPPVVTPTVDIDIEKNFVRRGGKTSVDFTVNSNSTTTCTIIGVQTTPIIFTHNASSSSAVYGYTTKVLNASQEIQMTCVVSGVDDAVVDGRINVIPSVQEF